jgi:hypothetical protein
MVPSLLRTVDRLRLDDTDIARLITELSRSHGRTEPAGSSYSGTRG